jgi:outer membrane protein assembly factor BamB
MPAGVVSGAGGQEPRSARGAGSGAEPGPGLPRRRLLLGGAGLVSAAALGAVVWEGRHPDGPRPPGAATREPLARRSAIWQATVTVPRPQVMAATDGMVCVAGDDGVYFDPGTAHDVVQALNARDGSYRWTFTIRSGGSGMGVADPPGLAAAPGYVYVTFDRLYCLRAGDGARVWSRPSPFTINLAAGPDAVYAVQETLFALSSGNGARLWSFPADASAMPGPILADGVIYVLGNGMQGTVVAAVRASDGARLWDSPGPDMGWLACDGTTVCAVSGLGADAQITGNGGPFPSQMWTYRASDGKLVYRSAFNAGYGPPAVTAGMAFALTARNGHIPSKLHAVDPGTGRTVWSYPGASAAPAAARGRVYTASPAGDLTALNATDGTPVWHCPIRVTLGPVIAGNTVYACDSTTVYAVPA